MTTNAATFEATIRTVDKASGPFRAITERIAAMTGATATAERAMERLDKPHMFQLMAGNIKALGGHVAALRGRFEALGSAIGGVHGRLSALFPALGGLAALTSVGGLVHLVDNVADSRAQQLERIQRLGVDPKRLGALTMAAKAARVPIEDLDSALLKLSNNIVEAGQGKNKDFAALFRHLGMSLRDSKGQFRDAAEVMQDFFEAFQKTTNGALRERMARILAGKGGDKLLQMFMLKKEELRAIAEDTKGLTYTFSSEDDENLKNYSRQMAYLKVSVSALGNAIAAKLAPVLLPAIKQMRAFLVAHRPEITKALEENVKRLTLALQQFDWERLGRDLRFVWDQIAGAVGAVGGLNRVMEVMIAWKVGSWALSFASGLVKIGREAKAVSLALFGVRDAAIAADSTTVFGGLLGRLALISRSLTAIGALIATFWPTSTAGPELDEAPPDGRPRRKDDSIKLSREIYERSLRPQWDWTIASPGARLPKGPLPAPSLHFALPSSLPTPAMPNGMPTLGPVFGSQFSPSLHDSSLPPSLLLPSLPQLPPVFAPQLPASLPSQDSGGLLRVKIDFANMPVGSRVNVDSGSIRNPVETNVGYANPLAFGY